MASSTLSDPFLFFAFWTGMAALALTLLLGAQIVWLRVSLRRAERREKQVIARWRPLVTAMLAGEPPAHLPAIRRRDRLVFLKMWIHLHESLRGSATDALNQMACRLRCDETALRLLRRRNRAHRLLGILALGHLRAAAASADLLRLSRSGDSTVSVKALWALVQIDPAFAAAETMAGLIRREDWPLPQLAGILQEAPEACTPALVAVLRETGGEHLPRALALAETLRIALPPDLARDLLAHPSTEVVIHAMRVAATPALLDAVRANAAHEDWRVRVQAAKVLGRIGRQEDAERLRGLLHDPQWWVRYRAAQALVALPFMNGDALRALRQDIGDRYARDMLAQVMAEKGMAE
ncbi:HEAT repeat domain-containing protein [Noviherbaspirillum aridicola]|uniref:HEAT repeat protein n=1 Tax=Noviherbaspirillum aridicola TaxID=2849687 RepID=A0ABQ4Q9I2_9BURK|nr:HEAT repeat domain-containing protein [Noviherbaspirillum aridicola]GIZ53732.1 hypothetical protein NCCP691_37460 [Noviherbaspirillum aridicola]